LPFIFQISRSILCFTNCEMKEEQRLNEDQGTGKWTQSWKRFSLPIIFPSNSPDMVWYDGKMIRNEISWRRWDMTANDSRNAVGEVDKWRQINKEMAEKESGISHEAMAHCWPNFCIGCRSNAECLEWRFWTRWSETFRQAIKGRDWGRETE
jgi:hypothetical protein